MKSSIGHIYIYVSSLKKSAQFYQKFLSNIGYSQTFSADWGVEFSNKETAIWLEQTPPDGLKAGKFSRRQTGLNHLAFKLSSSRAVDQFVAEFITPNGIPTLYNSPKAFPEYTKDYYAVFFEDPDKLKLEVAFY